MAMRISEKAHQFVCVCFEGVVLFTKFELCV